MSSSQFPIGGPGPSIDRFQSVPKAILFPNISSAGVSPGSTGNDNVLSIYIIPANLFDITFRGIQISASGGFGATANNKRVKLIINPTAPVVGSAVVGGTTIADSGTVATNGGGWRLESKVYKYGVPGSNTQIALNSEAQVGAAVAALLAAVLLTLVEVGPIVVVVTGNATTATTDILNNSLEVNLIN